MRTNIESNNWHKLILYIVLIGLSLIYLLPLLSSVFISLISSTDYLNGDIFPKHVTFENFIKGWSDNNIGRLLFNSTIVSLLIVSAQILVSSLAAYAFVFLDFRFRDQIFFIFLMTMMIPFEATFISNFQTIKFFGLIDTYYGIALPSFASAFSTFFLRQTFKQVPDELIEACQIAGFSHWKIYKEVVMPIAKQSLITLSIYQFLVAWNMYLWPLLVTTNAKVRTVQIGLRQIQTEEALTQWGVVMASAIMVAIPTLLILYFSQKRLQDGLAEGAIK
ncbi:carbohydrate ABC transporter permease [Floricoccus penangensis]|uniref:Glycerol-3-phosphate ABC transporter permease n=1 Tax=Floricoccus penangensis TaxID=1859475 RepID=A0A9Q5JFS7_9LACT|nr:carbohydrate ABC transporter permease [Floricoccus penangensis]OFI46245.1 glycerol-3-phosphate ABC transporter permease [Floricoccus penangensis]URZ86967.1 carbohydrate ABC transporter permease [Floricoccus penangensis]